MYLKASLAAQIRTATIGYLFCCYYMPMLTVTFKEPYGPSYAYKLHTMFQSTSSFHNTGT
eukprot:scaffold27701_cov10-Tisochrysis_lutea.AAC.1